MSDPITAIETAIPHEAVIRLNVPVLLFSLGMAVFTTLLFGLAPAIQMAKRDIVEPLKDSGEGVSGGFRHGKLRASVVVEVALSVVLLTGAGLLMRSFVSLQQVNLGLNPHNKYARLGNAPNPFIDPDGCQKELDINESVFRRTLEQQRSAAK